MTVLNSNEFIKLVHDYNYIQMSNVNVSFRNSPQLISGFYKAKAKVQISNVENRYEPNVALM